MADGRPDTADTAPPSGRLWTNIFRSFQVALDPQKLVAAAAGILVTSLLWAALSAAFSASNPKPNRGADEAYKNTVLDKQVPAKEGVEREKQLTEEGDRRFARDLDQWKVLDELAGPGGKLSTMPWDEFRGENPYLFATRVVSQPSATWGGEILTYLSRQIPVVTEPVHKLLVPVIKLVDPRASFGTRLYLLLCLACSVAVWAFFGGIITRLAAVQFAGGQVNLVSATKFVLSRYVSYILSPIVPLGVIAVIVLLMFLYGLVALIPWVGDLLLYGLLFPLIVLGGIAMAVILIGLVGYPLMYTTISTEGSDTFDAISRSYNYVFQAPWTYAWYSFIALLYGAVVTFVVILIGCLTILLGKWAMGSAASLAVESRKPDFLFVYAPESLGWKQLLLNGSDIAVRPQLDDKGDLIKDKETGRPITDLQPVNEQLHDAYRKDMRAHNKAGAGIVSFWMVIVFLMMIGFAYSYFWTAFTMVYLLMRKKVDEVEIDEVYIETAPPAPTPAPGPAPSTAPSGGGTSLPVVPPPVVPPPLPPTPTAHTTVEPIPPTPTAPPPSVDPPKV
jgi:hypothetical protein